MVYVLNIKDKPLMPCSKAKARKLLKKNRATIVKYTPFTIKLSFECEDKAQKVSLGVDTGSKIVGLSATTKNTRIENSLPKEHKIDARCISGNPLAKPAIEYYYQRKVRCHNRQIHKANLLKDGRRKNNQATYKVKRF